MKTTETISQNSTSKAVANTVKVNHAKLAETNHIQARLKIGEPGDKYEVEADQTADRIMSMSEPLVQNQSEEEEEIVQAKPFIQTQSLEEEEETLQAKWIQREAGKEEEEDLGDEAIPQEEEPLQAKPLIQAQPVEEEEPVQAKNESSSDGAQTATPWIESQISSSSGNGSPLSANTQSFMENRFGSDFSSVRVHTNSGANEMNQHLGAQAFTVGRDIYFNSGKYSPESSTGKHLLAHELTHVVQQGASASLKRKPSQPWNKKSDLVRQVKPSVVNKPRRIQRGIMDDLRALGSAVTGVVTSVAQTIGSGVSAALGWIRNVSSLIGSSIVAAWNWIRSVARNIGVGLRTAYSWVRDLIRIVGLGAREAFDWIRSVSRQIRMGIRSALSWLRNVSNIIGSGIRDAFNWISNLARAIGSGFRFSWSWILSVAEHIGLGIRNAFDWVTRVAGIIGLGIRAAWRWVRNLSLRLTGMAIAAAFQWIVDVATRITLGVLDALIWLVNLGRQIHAVLLEAWGFIVRLASILVTDVLNALAWLRRVAQSIARSLRTALEFVERVASFIGRSIRRAWDWITEVARRIGRSILAAWEWIRNVARLIGRTLVAAWNFVRQLIRQVGRAIRQLVNWLLAPLPAVIVGNFRNSGSTSSKNNCALCPLPLGQSTTDGTNGMELRGDITGHNPLIKYDFKRTKERATWKKSGTTWTQLTHVGPGADDDSHNSDEDLTPDSDQIFVIDTPGFRNSGNPVRDHSASEAVYKASFVETVKAKKLIGPWTTVSNSFSWHSISWFENVGGSWGRKATSNEIDTGTTTVGSGDP